jgi:hypothetical protein
MYLMKFRNTIKYAQLTQVSFFEDNKFQLQQKITCNRIRPKNTTDTINTNIRIITSHSQHYVQRMSIRSIRQYNMY